MRYLGTRAGDPVDFVEALRLGLDESGGLFVPERMPRQRPQDWLVLDDAAMARALISPFVAESPLEGKEDQLALPLLNLPIPTSRFDDGLDLLELWHGPTAAFKDLGASFLAKALELVDDEPSTVLVATSGDTGSAVAAAFANSRDVRVLIFYPRGRVSPLQESLLNCWGDSIRGYAVEGSFDDCQGMVKSALEDPDFCRRHALRSANSINIGRLLPQVWFYLKCSCRHFREYGRSASFIVPTGNLGNGLAALWARELGAPIDAIRFAANANDGPARVLSSGVLVSRPSLQTLATAMDVGHPSNAERLLWQLRHDHLDSRSLSAGCSDDAAIARAMRHAHRERNRLICPHTAVGYDSWLSEPDKSRDWVLVATAHPTKFEETLCEHVGRTPDRPERLKRAIRNATPPHIIGSDAAAFRSALESEPTSHR